MKLALYILLIISTQSNAQVNFSSEFESGNLSSVSTSDSVTFNVRTKEDIGGRWFYFKIAGVEDRYLRTVIQNSDVNRPMYSYDNLNFIRFSESESPNKNLFQKTFSNDSVYIAYYTPYNYSFLQNRLNTWRKSEFVKLDTLGYSPNNFPMQMMTLTDFSVPDDSKHKVWIHARTHPGETPSSFHFDGIVQKLLEDDEVIEHYRKNIIFYLIPFNNPEGVYYGRSRTNFNYIDQEREWNKEPSETALEIQILKEKLQSICDEKPVDVFLNLHSQAAPYCTFWIHTPGSTSETFYRKEYQFSNLNVSDNPYFAQSDFGESNLQSYFPEGWLWNSYGESVMALTYETPYDRYSNGDWVTNENLYELGYRTVYAIAEYLGITHPKHMIVDNTEAVINGEWNNTELGKEFYGENFIYNSTGDGSVSFQSWENENGIYDIYAWWPTSDQNSYQTDFEIVSGQERKVITKTQRTNGGQWNFIADLEVQRGNSIEVNVNANSTGLTVADAVRIVYRAPLTNIADKQLPIGFKLYPNYPNPFNPSTSIRFETSKHQQVQLSVYNSIGELITILVDETLSPGTYEKVFNSAEYNNLSSGVYYINLSTNEHSITKGMILLK